MFEQVLVVPTKLLQKCGYFEGLVPVSANYLPLFQHEAQTFRPRNEVEEDPSWKQLIPYIVVERGGLLLNYYRGEGQGEVRLHGQRSIGIGGHINPCDLEDTEIGRIARREDYLSDRYVRGMLRELTEELQFSDRPDYWDLRVVGLLNEDQTPVGNVHLGVVHMLHMDFGDGCTAKEADVLDLDWHTHEVLLQDLKSFELWSQICLKHIEARRPDV